jgi:hypothetical protein
VTNSEGLSDDLRKGKDDLSDDRRRDRNNGAQRDDRSERGYRGKWAQREHSSGGHWTQRASVPLSKHGHALSSCQRGLDPSRSGHEDRE